MNYELRLNVDFYLVDEFESKILVKYFNSSETSSFKIIERKAMMYDIHGEAYVGYCFSTTNYIDFFILGKYVGQFLL